MTHDPNAPDPQQPPQYHQQYQQQPQYQPQFQPQQRQQPVLSRMRVIQLYFAAAVLAIVGIAVMVSGVSKLSEEVEVNYPQADQCGTYFQPITLSGEGTHPLEIRQAACDEALDSALMTTLGTVGVGLLLLALGTVCVLAILRNRRVKRAYQRPA